MPGYSPGSMDPIWKTWPRFVGSLRSSFSSGISRAQAVRKWEDLRHTTSIDDFLDELTRLQWKTGYSGDIVKDKLQRSLQPWLAEQWAAKLDKPHSVDEQVRALREMGQAREQYLEF